MTHHPGSPEAVDLRIVHAVARGEHDREGRVARLDRRQPRIVGVLANTPWPIAGRNPVAVMLDSARGVRLEHDDPRKVLERLFDAVDRSLVELASGWHTDEGSFDAMWDFGGHAALVAVVGGRVAVGRVGDLRVSRLAGGELTTVLAENTLVAEMRDAGREVGGDVPGNVITDSLGSGAEPKQPRVLLADVSHGTRFVIASGSGMATLGSARAQRALTLGLREAASTICDAAGGTAVAAIVDVVKGDVA